MKMMNLLGVMACCLSFPDLYAQHQIKFDVPNPLSETPAWGGNVALVSAGDAVSNLDKHWEHTTLPIGNGSIGANVYGSIGTERITFNEKSLWRGGPNTSKGAAYYWNVNKESAHVLKDIKGDRIDPGQF